MSIELPLDGAGAVHDVASFRVRHVRFLDEQGEILGNLPDFAVDGDELTTLYRAMVFTRLFDEKAVALQRTGRLGTYASSLGQEAVSVGLASAMREVDVLLPSFREHGAQLWRGVTPVELLVYWGGDERGSDFAGPQQDFPVSIPVASHIPHAAGVALAFKLRREQRVAICVFGDGATSKGDFYEAINLAAVWRLPVVFVICNNQWAISVPVRAQSAARTLAQKAIAAGMEGVQVDGNDVIAVRHVVEAAIDQARSGDGPSLVEALTYRLGDHTTADDARRYRNEEEVRDRWRGEPIGRLRTYLTRAHDWSKDQEREMLNEHAARLDEAVAQYLATPPDSSLAMFDHLYEALPEVIQAQRAEVERRGQGSGVDG